MRQPSAAPTVKPPAASIAGQNTAASHAQSTAILRGM